MSIQVRRAEVRDINGILACLASAFAPFRERYTPAAYLDTVLTPESLRCRMEAMCVLVAVDASARIIGTVSFEMAERDEGHVRGMAVLPAWHGSDAGSRLLRAAEDQLCESGAARISLDTTEPLQRAIRFYQRHGFAPSGRVRNFFGMRLYEYVKVLRRERSAP